MMMMMIHDGDSDDDDATPCISAAFSAPYDTVPTQSLTLTSVPTASAVRTESTCCST